MINSKFNQNKMKSIYLIILLISVTISIGCNPKKEIVDTSGMVKISQPRVFANTFKNGLYKTDLQIHDHELSGLMFFNKKDKSMRVVMLSEVGFKYFDIEYVLGNQNPFTFHQVTDLLNHDKFIGSIQNFLSMIMINVDEQHQTYKGDQPGFLIRKESKDAIKTDYIYNSNSGAISNIKQKKITIELTDYDYLAPGNIIFLQGKIQYILNKVKKE